MVVMPDWKIYEELRIGDLDITPFRSEQVEPSSYDMRLDDDIKVFSDDMPNTIVPNETSDGDYMDTINISDGYVLEPDEFVLASTVETVNIPDYLSAVVYGRSSFGRIGVEIHRAGWIDSGFTGNVTLEIENEAPCNVLLEPDVRICQLVFHDMKSRSKNPYDGDYQGQSGVTDSKFNK